MSSCQEEFPLRFETEKNPSVGTMEIFSNSSWQKLCTSQWDEADENSTCMAMGYYNNGANDTWYAERGNATEMSTHYNCTIPTRCQNDLEKKQQFCKVPVRLNGANVEYGGRVEVFYKGKWAKICRNKWDFDDVKVICRQLGFEEALAEFIGSDIKAEGIPFAMSDVSCTGEEFELASCDRIDGKLNIPPQCQSDDKGSQALCQPKNKNVLERVELYFDIGSGEKLRCSIHNKTNHARWVINGGKLEITNSTSQRIRAGDNGDLFIDDVQLSDGGTYECQRLEYVQYYIVYINARFTEKTLDQQTVIAYESGIISCSADGTPSPQISWSKKGRKSLDPKRFTQVSNGSLRIGFVKPEDDGTFTCTMKQTKGAKRVTSKDKDIRVRVIIRPDVYISGASNLIIEGSSVNLTCEVVAGRPEPRITWLKNITLQRESSSLFFSEITKEDEGRYTCKAENEAGISTKDIKISVKVPPHVRSESRNLTIAFDYPFIRECYFRGDPQVSVNWTKDGVLISKNNTLVIRKATFKDKGYYECTAKNDYGEAKSSFWIDVTVFPQIIKPPINQSVTEGNSVNFSCRATGVPTPTLVWVFNNGDLPSGINQFNHKGESFLEFLSVTKGMEGTYKCEAKNKANTTSSSATLRVYGKASVQVFPDQYPAITAGDNLTLTCNVNEETINVTWKKDGDSPPERAKIDTRFDDKKSTFAVTEVVKEDSGVYSCEGRNKLGFVDRSFVKINIKAKQVPRAMQSFNTLWFYIGGSVAAAIVILLIAWYFCKLRRAAPPEVPPRLNEGEDEVEMDQLNLNTDGWEIAADRLNLREHIGRGAFGSVWRALLGRSRGRPGNRTVAAKCYLPISGEKGRKALLREIELLKLFGREGHENVVKFIGCVTVGVSRASSRSCTNILLDEHRVCKLTDFSLIRISNTAQEMPRGCIPIKWTAPEILFGHVEQLSTKSDVWSYGIVLYEIFTVGGIPYEGWSQSTTMKKIEEGYRLPKPEHIDDSLYAVMLNCWKYESASRPHFVKLYQTMDTYIKTKTYVDIFDDDKYDQDKYNFVDDRGAVANPEDAGPDELGAAAANPIGEVGEHGATAHPFLVAMDDDATAFPLGINVGDEGAPATDPDREVGEHGATAHPFVIAIDDGAQAFPFAINVPEKGAAAANLAHDVGKHGAAAHSFVVAIDDGATAFPFAINLQDKGAAAANLAHEVGKHGATAHPFVVAIDDGATAFPFAINLQDKGAAAGNLAREVGKHGATAHPSMVGIDDGATAFPLGIKVEEEGCAAYPFESDKKDMDAQAYPLESDTLPYLSENEEEDVDDSECPLAIEEEEIDDYECPLAIEEEEIDPLPSSLVMDEDGLAASACPLVTDEENSDSLACPLVVEEEDSNNSACSPVPGEEDLEATECLSVTEKEDPTSFARSANEVNKPDASPFPCVIEEEDLDSLEYNPLIEKEGLSDSVFPPEIQTDDEEGVTSEPENTVGYEGAVAVQSEKEAVEEEPKTCQLEYTKDEQDDLGNYMDDQSDAVDLFDGDAGVQEYDGNQLTAADIDETGSDEDEESSEATPLVQD
nr:inactive tyrosine-protein kinase 7-like [Pocillopora verrucosa]